MDKNTHVTTETERENERFLSHVVAVLNNSLIELTPREIERLSHAHSAALALIDGEEHRQRPLVERELIDSSTELPLTVRLRLDAIRAASMREAEAQLQRDKNRSPSHGRWGRLFSNYGMPVSAFASVGVLVTAIALFNFRDDMTDSSDPVPLVVIEVPVLLASEEDLELYENLEFYQWLVESDLQL